MDIPCEMYDDEEIMIGGDTDVDDDIFLATQQNTTTDRIFDVKKFFSVPSISEKVFDEAKRHIYERIESPLCRLEQEGHELFLQNQRDRKEKAAEKKLNDERMIQKSLDDLLIKGDPREYQRRLLEIALSRNTIVNLGTGAGKTLIALLCIKEKHAKGKAKTLFVVPSVALAIQHSFTLRANLPNFWVETACYATAKSSKAREKFAQCDVLCATHGAILDLLMHWGDLFSLGSFNLVVIDECHYAGGNHPYNQIMTKFYRTLPCTKRPHILGLTASPILNLKESYTDEQLLTLLGNLEKSLDATLVSASGLAASDVSEWQSRDIHEEQLQFRQSNKNRAIPSANNLNILKSRLREFKQLDDLYEDLGPLVLQVYCRVLLRELSRNRFEGETRAEFEEALEYLRRVEDFCSQEIRVLPVMGRTDKLLVLEQLVEELIGNDDGRADAIGLVFMERRITAMALHCYFQWRGDHIKHDKSWLPGGEARRQLAVSGMSRLYNQGMQHDDPFSDSSDDPWVPLQNLCTVPECDNMRRTLGDCTTTARASVKSVAVVRNPTQIFNSLSISQNPHSNGDSQSSTDWNHKELKLRDTMAKLRNGDINLIFATSVVEEGVDLQSCSFVVAFDGISSVKSYIQMKGRARHRSAKFFLLYDFLSTVEKLTLVSAQALENRVQTLILEKMKAKSFTANESQDAKPFETSISEMTQETVAVENGFYKAEEAMVDFQSAKSLLYRFFLSIPVDPFVRSRKDALLAFLPLFTEDRLELPPYLPHRMRIVILPEIYESASRKEKEQILSVMACARLHRYGLLNKRLLPLSAKDVSNRIMEALPFCDVSEIKRASQFSHESVYSKVYVYPVQQQGYGFNMYEAKLKGMGHCLAVVTMAPIESSFGPIHVVHKEFGNMKISLHEPNSFACNQTQWKLLQKVFCLLLNSRWSRPGRGISYEIRAGRECNHVIPSYTIGILSKTLALDWEFMTTLINESERSDEERRCSNFQSASSLTMARPRIWIPSHSRSFTKYIVFKASGRSCDAAFPQPREGVRTFREYFETSYSVQVSDDEPLFEAQYIWTNHSGLSTVSDQSERDNTSDEASFKSVELPPSVCFEAPLANAHIAVLTVFLPQLLYLLERHQTTQAFMEYTEECLPSLGSFCRRLSNEKICMALTAKSSNMDDNYEKLEWLGDAVLKLLQTDSLVKSGCLEDIFHYLHEGNLSMLRASMGTNDRLKEICARLGLDRYVIFQSLSRGSWAPAGLKVRDLDTLSGAGQPPKKSHADVLEALLGLIYINFGYKACMEIGNELALSLSWDETEDYQREKAEAVDRDLPPSVQTCTGYSSFIQPCLLKEAFSHPTAIDSEVPSYQRLEWIGDAVACLCVREWLFNHIEGELELKDLVLIEDAIVSNETFGWLSMKYGLPHLLNHRDQTLPGRIEAYVSRVQNGSGLWNTDPPKTIADITESVLGAIHMDGGFRAGQTAALRMLGPIFQFVEERAQEKDMERLVFAMQHPKRSLQELTGELLELNLNQDGNSTSFISEGVLVLEKDKWHRATMDASSHVAAVKILDQTLLAVSDDSASISLNRVAFLAVKALLSDQLLLQRIQKCQAAVAKGGFISESMVNGSVD